MQQGFEAGPADGTPMEKVAPHVRAFYRTMMGLMDKYGVEGDTQVAKSMKALGIKEQMAPAKSQKFGRRDRQKLKEQMVCEGKIVLHKTRRTKGIPAVIDPRAVDKLIADLPQEAKATPEAITATIGRLFRFTDPDKQMRAALRANRFMQNNPDKRLPAHIREAAVMSTAVMIAVTALFPEDENAVPAAAAALREQFAGVGV